MGDIQEDTTASPAPLPHQEDGVVMELGEGQTLTRMPSAEALVASLRGHSCWVCGASADTHDANLDHLMAHLQAAPPVPTSPPYGTPADALEHDKHLDGVVEASAVEAGRGETPSNHGAEVGVEDDPAPSDSASEPTDAPSPEAPVVADVSDLAPAVEANGADLPVDQNTATDAPRQTPEDVTESVNENPSMDTAHAAKDAGSSPTTVLAASPEPSTPLQPAEPVSLLDPEEAALLDAEGPFPASPETTLQPMHPDIVLQPGAAGSALLYGAPSPLPSTLIDTDIQNVLLHADDDLVMESTSLFAEEEDLTARSLVPTLQALNSALEGLAADVAAAAGDAEVAPHLRDLTPAPAPAPETPAADPAPTSPSPTPPTPEVTFFKEPPRHSYTRKPSKQRPSLDLIVSRLFSQRAAIEAAAKAAEAAKAAKEATLLDENCNVTDAVQHDFQAVIRDEDADIVVVPDEDDDDDLDDGYAVTAAALDAQHPNSLVCAICLGSFQDRDTLLRHVEDEVRELNKHAKASSKRGRGRPRKNPSSETEPSSASPRKRPVRAVAKKAATAAVVEAPPPPTTPPAATDRWSCPHCHDSFPRRSELREHVAEDHKDVAADRPHKCPVCPKQFARRAHLEQHQLVHEDERPFQCGHCGSSFRRKDRLVAHVRTHTPRGAESSKQTAPRNDVGPKTRQSTNGLPPQPPPPPLEEVLKCLTCFKTFPIKSRLRRHVMQVHAATMPNVCLTCGKDCVTRKRQLAHTERHITDRVSTFSCADCGDVLDDKRSLLQHRRSRHGDDGAPKEVKSEATTEAPPSAAPSPAPSNASSSTSSSSASSGMARPAAAPKESVPRSKPPQKYVFKIVSKNGSSHTANMAAKLLPTLASDFAAKRSGPKRPSKVVYMVMSKNSKAGTGTAPAAGDKPVSKVLMRIVSKDGAPKKVPCLVPRTPPKLGFKVVSKVVPLDSNASKEASRASPASQAAVGRSSNFFVPSSSPALPTPALRPTPAPGTLGSVSFGGPYMGAPSSAAPSTSASSMGSCFLEPPVLEAAFQPAPALDPPSLTPPSAEAPFLGGPYLDPPCLDAAPLEPPVIELDPPGPSWNKPSSSQRLVGQLAADGRYLCNTCGRRFVSEPLYVLHLQAHGKAVKTFECQCCGQRFLSKDLLRAHWQTHM